VLSLATKRSWKNRETGERQSETTWHRLHRVGEVGRVRCDSHQGRARTDRRRDSHSRVHAEGTGKKAPDVKKSITEVRVTSILKLDRAHASGNSAPEGGAPQEVAA